MKKKLVLKGKDLIIFALTDENKELSIFERDLCKLARKDADIIVQHIQYMANNISILWNKSKFNRIVKTIYEFKVKQFRVFTFNESDNLEKDRTKKKEMIILYIFQKKVKKTPKEEIKRCEKMIKEIKN